MFSPTKKKIAILGGGQLGRMLIQSGIDLNLHFHVLDPDPNAPCHGISDKFVKGSLNDAEVVFEFGKSAEIITIEIENVSVEALKKLEADGK
ncbi:MAG: 5-(carboxyamino)imidazole ribonucleotide synthase, partial [Bacteroidia bacterium]